MRRDHRGIAYREGFRREPVDHRVDANPAKMACRACGRQIHYVRKTYGPNGRAGFWQHSGDGLAQYRSWGIAR